MDKRNVSRATLLQLILEKKPFSTIGLLFSCFGILLFPLMAVMGNFLQKPYEKYDFEKINQAGIPTTAQITYLDDVSNVSVNGKHPKLIQYEYNDSGQLKTDRFETLELDKVWNFKIGQNIAIKTLDGQSIIQDLQPFSFPFFVFYLFPTTFLCIGLVFLFIAVRPALKLNALYKNGVVRHAELLSIMPVSGMRISNSGRHLVLFYAYFTKNGRKLQAEATTYDFSMLAEKKPGDEIMIFVSEENETQTCLVPKRAAIKNNWRL